MMPVVVVSGWAMSAEIMAPLVEALSGQDRIVTVMSLADAPEQSWEALLTTLAQQIEEKSVLVGWSLGGNLCMRFAARYPEVVAGVVTLGSTPCFVSAQDWQVGKTESEFREFADMVAENMAVALKGFIPACASGSPDTKGTLRFLRRTVPWTLERSEIWPELLNRLAEDGRSEWKKVVCPATHFLATGDPLAGVAIAEKLAYLLPKQDIHTVTGSHVIFADHASTVVKCVLNMRERA